MESTKFHKLQTKKTTKPQKHHRHLRKIASLLRYAEVCVVLVLVSKLSVNLPTTLKNSSEYFRNFMGSPRFVFFLGNVIIITLFAQSGQFLHHSSEKGTPEPDLYLEFLHNSTINMDHVDNRKPKASDGVKGHDDEVVKDYRRCESEIVKRERSEKVLKRCETEKEGVANNSKSSYPEDGMSNDEFRRKVEAFIARQQKLRAKEQTV
ncbi:hypothetical protein Fmac_000110 [Flemingia macrophylla]|uniref:DUF4408 domain-containing protein n=1 Tax=Flemingia macrophylla TaxID=520843 RepID=A0ABD1NDC8_9FABA